MDGKSSKRKRLTAKSVGLLSPNSIKIGGRLRLAVDVDRFKCYNPACGSRFFQTLSGNRSFRLHLKNNLLCSEAWTRHQSVSSQEVNDLEVGQFLRHCSKCGKNYNSEVDHYSESPSCERHFKKVSSAILGMEIPTASNNNPVEEVGAAVSLKTVELCGIGSTSRKIIQKKDGMMGLKEEGGNSNDDGSEYHDALVFPEVSFNDDFVDKEECFYNEELEEDSFYDDDEASNAANLFMMDEQAPYGKEGGQQEDTEDLMWQKGVTIVDNGPGNASYVRGDPPKLGCIIHYPVSLVLQRSARLNARQRFCFELYKALEGSSLGTFDSVKDIVSRQAPDLFQNGQDIPSREVFLKEMAAMFPTEAPTEVVVTLEGYAKTISGPGNRRPTKKNTFQGMERTEQVKMYTWNMKNQMQADLLNVRTMGNVKKLVVNQDSDPKSTRFWLPYEPIPGDDEIMAGKWYQDTVKNDGLDHHINMYIVPYFYTDATGTDVNQKYPVEPLIWCLAILKRPLREDSRNWNPLAYLADTNQSSAAMRQLVRSRKSGKGLSARNYHRMLDHALAEFSELQRLGKEGKLHMWVRMGDYVKYLNILCPLYGVLGDGKSGDIQVTRFGGHNTTRMCRLCTASYSDCGNPAHRCKMMCMRDIHVLFKLATDLNSTKEERQKYLDELQSLSMHVVDNAYFRLDFGANKHGIFLATPSDMMHLYELGVLCYVLALFVNSMTTSVRMKVDLAVEELFKSWRSSKKKDFLRMNFVRGCTSISLLTASEWPGLAFCYLIVLLTENGKEITKDCFSERATALPEAAVKEIRKTKFELRTARPKILEKFTDAQLDNILSNELDDGAGAQLSEDDDSVIGDGDDDDDSDTERNNNELDNIEGVVEDSPEESFAKEVFHDSSKAAEESDAKKKGSKQKKAIPLSCTRLQFIDLLLTMLSFHAWYKSDFPTTMMETEEEMSEVLRKIRMMMLKITTFCPRAEGNGWNLQKFHELSHIVIFIYYFKSCNNFDAGSGERSLKVFVKKLAKQAQKRGNVFLGQLCRRVWEMMMMNKVEDNETMWNELVSPDDEGSEENPDSSSAGKPIVPCTVQSRKVEGHAKYRIWYDEGSGTTKSQWANKKTLTSIHPVILNFFDKFFRTEYGNNARGVIQNSPVIQCWTEYVVVTSQHAEEDEDSTTRLRCHENFRQEGFWYDYCFVKYEDGSTSTSDFFEFPAKVLCFYKLHPEGETLCLIHSCDYMKNIISGNKKNRGTNHSEKRKKEYWSNALCERWVLESKKVMPPRGVGNDRTPHFVPVINSVKASSIQDCALVFEENPGIKESTTKKQHCWVVHDRLSEWPKHFLKLPFRQA